MTDTIKTWIKKTAIKTIKTMAQTAVGVIGSAAVLSAVDWKVAISATILSGVVCILMNISQIEEE